MARSGSSAGKVRRCKIFLHFISTMGVINISVLPNLFELYLCFPLHFVLNLLLLVSIEMDSATISYMTLSSRNNKPTATATLARRICKKNRICTFLGIRGPDKKTGRNEGFFTGSGQGGHLKVFRWESLICRRRFD